MYRIPIYQPDLGGNELKYVTDCIQSTWISSKGRYVNEFENAFAERVGTTHAVSVCNGTVALHLALVALGIGPGDEVIVPTLTYIASVNAITYTGATPVFADSVASSWQLDPADAARHITPRTRAILLVHLYGQSCDMEPLLALAREHRLFVIEDCAEAIGTFYKGRHVGSFGDISTFSFFGNKTMTTGEGGMVVSNDRTLVERSRHFRGQGLADHREYWHDVVGFNYRMTNIAAALGMAQLERVDGFLARKRALAAEYREALAGLPVSLHEEQAGTVHSYWMVSILVDDPRHREPLRLALKADGVETRPLFYPVHTMPMYSKEYRRHAVAENLSWRGVNLPSWPGLQREDVASIASTMRRYFDAHA